MVEPEHSSAGWYVHLSVSDEEGGDLLAAAGGIVGEGGASLLASPQPAGVVALARPSDKRKSGKRGPLQFPRWLV